MTGNIFINYRRTEDWSFAYLLCGQLEQKYDREHIFFDVDSIGAGHDFVAVLAEKVAQSDVFLAIIGRNWLEARDKDGKRRLDDPQDFVRIEIEQALNTRARIIPLLVGGAQMPDALTLPESMRNLCKRQALSLSPERFKADAQQLATAVERALAEMAEDKRRDNEAWEKAARDNTLDALQGYLSAFPNGRHAQEAKQQLDGLARRDITDDKLRTQAELYNWEFIKDRKRENEVRKHLSLYLNGPTAHMARVLLEQIVWARVTEANDLDSFEAYLAEFPDGEFAKEAREKHRQISVSIETKRSTEAMLRRKKEEEVDWETARSSVDDNRFRNFLARWPEGVYATQARAAIARLDKTDDRSDTLAEQATRATDQQQSLRDASALSHTANQDTSDRYGGHSSTLFQETAAVMARWSYVSVLGMCIAYLLSLATLTYEAKEAGTDIPSWHNRVWSYLLCAAVMIAGVLVIWRLIFSGGNKDLREDGPYQRDRLSVIIMPILALLLPFSIIALSAFGLWPFGTLLESWPTSGIVATFVNVWFYALPLAWFAALQAIGASRTPFEQRISLSYASATILTLTPICLYCLAQEYDRWNRNPTIFPEVLVVGLSLASYGILVWFLYRMASHLSARQYSIQGSSLLLPQLVLTAVISIFAYDAGAISNFALIAIWPASIAFLICLTAATWRLGTGSSTFR